jgi:hypothetical protein
MNFTAAELRAMADNMALPATKACAALREYADIKEAAENGVTDEVVTAAYLAWHDDGTKVSMRKALLAVAPLLALKGDKP